MMADVVFFQAQARPTSTTMAVRGECRNYCRMSRPHIPNLRKESEPRRYKEAVPFRHLQPHKSVLAVSWRARTKTTCCCNTLKSKRFLLGTQKRKRDVSFCTKVLIITHFLLCRQIKNLHLLVIKKLSFWLCSLCIRSSNQLRQKKRVCYCIRRASFANEIIVHTHAA